MAKFKNMAICLAHTSTIKVIVDENRVVFNLDYSIVRNGNALADYIYVNDYTKEDLKFLNLEYFKENFIEYEPNGFINKNCIVSAKYNHEKQCIIFNLNHLHTYKLTISDENEVSYSKKTNIPKYVYMKATYDEFQDMFIGA